MMATKCLAFFFNEHTFDEMANMVAKWFIGLHVSERLHGSIQPPSNSCFLSRELLVLKINYFNGTQPF